VAQNPQMEYAVSSPVRRGAIAEAPSSLFPSSFLVRYSTFGVANNRGWTKGIQTEYQNER
jgi:hypothetical protein